MSVYSKIIIVCIIAPGFILSSCGGRSQGTAEQKPEVFDSKNLPSFIEKELQGLKADTSFKHYFDTLNLVYSRNKYQPIWLDKIEDPTSYVQLKELRDSIRFEGLQPSHYFTDSLLSWMSRLKNLDPAEKYIIAAKTDVFLSNFMLSVWHDKVLGRTNPKEVLGMKYTLPYPNHPGFELFHAFDPDSGINRIKSYHPSDADFWKLKKLLMKAYEVTDGRETFIDTAGIRKIKAGDTTYIVPLVARRLVELGLMSDSLYHKYDSANIYTRELANIIKNLQKESNLTNDGIIGKSTLKLLNASHNDKIDEIRANLERLRWFGAEFPKPYVRVNIPEFMLYMYYPDSIKTLQVCVGKGKERLYDVKKQKYAKTGRYFDKPLNHETPQVYSNIDYIVLNPTWTVPSSIVGREMYGQIVRDPEYLTKNGYQVLKDGKPVDPKTIKWRNYKPGNIPYTIRQNAGDDNSLGRIKFTFRNPFDVYMHDTPLKSKFKLSNRAVSHGCVRVQDPVELTGFVLQQNERTTYDDVLEMMGMPPKDTGRARLWREDTTSYKKIVSKTKLVRLENKLTVFFDYRTVVFDEYEIPRFVFDVYDKNLLIIEAMNKK